MPLMNTWKLEKSRDRLCHAVHGVLHGQRIRTYWWGSKKNFGDLITPALLLAYGYTPVYEKKHRAELLSTGSILDGVKESFSGQVLGSGLIRDHQVRLPNARFLAVRGKLTRDRLGLDESMPLGDPGLLAEKLLTKPVAKRYRLGVIPHYADKQDAKVLALLQQQGDTACLIDPEAYPEAVIRQIAACEQVVSSSLHGIIVAHALGIPAVWMQLSESVAGGGFKFHDYASSVQAELRPVELKPDMTLSDLKSLASLPDPALLIQRRDELDRLFNSLLSGAE